MTAGANVRPKQTLRVKNQSFYSTNCIIKSNMMAGVIKSFSIQESGNEKVLNLQSNNTIMANSQVPYCMESVHKIINQG